MFSTHHLSVLEVVQQDMEAFTLNAIVFHDNAGASDNFARVALAVDLAKAGPGTKNFSISNLDKVDLVLGAESLNELEIFGFSAGFDENAKMGLALVKSLGALAKTACKTVVQESVLQNLLETKTATNSQLRTHDEDRFQPT